MEKSSATSAVTRAPRTSASTSTPTSSSATLGSGSGFSNRYAIGLDRAWIDWEPRQYYHVTPGRFPYVIGGYRGVPEASNNRGLRHAGTGAIDDNAEGKSRMEAVMVDVRPGAMPRGGRREVTIILDPAAARRGPVPAGKPSWVQIGPYEAVAIERQGNTVTATFDIPADASVGMLLDCHIKKEKLHI